MASNLYRSTTNGVLPGLTRGQWVTVDGYANKGRLVGYLGSGQALVMKPNRRDKKGLVSIAAFRLACNKAKDLVLGTVPVKVESKAKARRLDQHMIPPRPTAFVEFMKTSSHIDEAV